MKQHISALVLALLVAQPAFAQQTPDAPADDDDGFSLMEEGARMIMRGLMTEMEPALDDMREAMDAFGPAFAEFAGSIGPAFADLLNRVDDIRNYEAPEFLPNGDIIIRRKPDAPEWLPDEGGEIDL